MAIGFGLEKFDAVARAAGQLCSSFGKAEGGKTP
jgi:hypothetical protein